MLKINNLTFKKILIWFWFIWWFIALWTDVIGGLAHLGLLQADWAPDTNYPNLVLSLQMYAVPLWLPAILFDGIIIWLAIATFSFAWAVIALNRRPEIWLRRAQIAFIISLTLWLAFFLADQIIMKFDLEENHMVQGGFQLLCYLALYLLPDEK